MGLRIFGAFVAVVLAAFAAARYRNNKLRRGEALLVGLVCVALLLAAAAPNFLAPLLGALGFHPGGERRIVGLLVISNLFTLALVFRGFSRDDELSLEIGELVDYVALRRFEESGQAPAPGSCVAVLPAYNEAANLASVL